MPKKKPVKKVATKPKKRVVKKKPVKNTEIVIRVEQPTMKDLDPIQGPKSKLMIPTNWVREKQVLQMLQKTPKQHIYSRPGKGGGEFQYVTGTYIKKVLNYVFGWNWDFEVVEHGKEGGQVWVLGKLTVKGTKDQTITKNQFGRADIKYRKGTKNMVDYGNDLKAATTDALKKCAAEFGIASDVYGKAEFKEVGKEIPEETEEVTDAEVVIDADTNEPEQEYLCHGATKFGCGKDMTKQEAEYSKKMYRKVLCRDCQKLKSNK